ncbi:OmpA family protein [Anaeromyxobacter paludicola]|uniref:OmpA-like domain-containing protein n=1 Tax=Anaeromyxobacter paludicola TaxID=2918171 RepID=A0ABM7X5X5_9BACT|nr:OmpA family protein [Anaeromyxobacter paludicola]BDG07209.1 hypothetical protein AMPC_03220 [Anaeromyxobacter paludicola]
MRQLLAAFTLLGIAGCAGGMRQGANPPPAPATICMPCGNPCQYPCQPSQPVAAAPAPAPTPTPTPPPPPPPPPAPEPAAAASFDPAPGHFTGAQQVTITSATPGAVIHYTTDGSAPTADSPVYTGPITVSKDTTVRAIAIAPGAPPSAESTAAYTIAPPAPPPRVSVTEKKLELTEKVFFDTGKTRIKTQSHALLDEVATVLKQHPEVKHVVVEGHTDDVGGAASNLKLSKGRAEAVRAYLVKKGVEASRLSAKGFGETRPVADNKTPAGRDANRRVEFVIPQ